MSRISLWIRNLLSTMWKGCSDWWMKHLRANVFSCAQLADIWNTSVPIQPEYQQYVDNIERFNTLITQLATTPPGVDSRLSGKFDFTSMLDALQNIVTKPEMWVCWLVFTMFFICQIVKLSCHCWQSFSLVWALLQVKEKKCVLFCTVSPSEHKAYYMKQNK